MSSSTPSGVTPKGRQYRTTEEERDFVNVRGHKCTRTEWRIEALQEGEDGPEWVTVGFILPYPARQWDGWKGLEWLIDTDIDSDNNPHRLTFTGLWLPPEVE